MTYRKQINIYFGKSQRDRIVATWLDNMRDDPDTNVSELVKTYLYQVATGTDGQQNVSEVIDVIKAEFAKLPSMLVMRDGVASPGITVTTDDIDEIARRLGSMPD